MDEWNWQLRSARLLLRTLITKPDLRLLVKQIRVGNWQLDNVATKAGDDILWQFNEPVAKNNDDTIVSAADLCSTVQSILALDSLPTETQDEFIRDLLDSSYDTMTMAILRLTSSLQSLVLSMDRETARHNVDHGFDLNELQTLKLIALSTTSLLAECNLFQNLHYVCMDGKIFEEECDAHSGGDWDIFWAIMFMKLPSLRTFHGSGFREVKIATDNETDVDTSMYEYGRSNVTEVVLTDCEIDAESICEILCTAGALEKFVCARNCIVCCHTSIDLSYDDVHDALYRHRKALRSLTLNTRSCGNFNDRVPGPVETLAFLENLEYLETDEDVLIGNTHPYFRPLVDILPKHLKEINMLTAGGPFPTNPFFHFVARELDESEALETVKVFQGYLENAEQAVEEWPGITIQYDGERNPKPKEVTKCHFLVTKRRVDEVELLSYCS